MEIVIVIVRFFRILVSNFYLSTGVALLVWMLFFDTNDLINQFKLYRKYTSMKAEKAFYEQKIVEVKKEKEEVFGSPRQVEKYAREKYLMKKPTEDIYLIRVKP